jgi:hypothetical protein
MNGLLWRLTHRINELPIEDVGIFVFYTSILKGRVVRTMYQPAYREYGQSSWLEIPAGALTSDGELVTTSMIKAVDYREALVIYRSSVRIVDNGR